jgi:hypothetical protein
LALVGSLRGLQSKVLCRGLVLPCRRGGVGCGLFLQTRKGGIAGERGRLGRENGGVEGIEHEGVGDLENDVHGGGGCGRAADDQRRRVARKLEERTTATAVDLRFGNSAGIEESECEQSNGNCTGTAGLLSDCRPRAGGDRFPWALAEIVYRQSAATERVCLTGYNGHTIQSWRAERRRGPPEMTDPSCRRWTDQPPYQIIRCTHSDPHHHQSSCHPRLPLMPLLRDFACVYATFASDNGPSAILVATSSDSSAPLPQSCCTVLRRRHRASQPISSFLPQPSQSGGNGTTNFRQRGLTPRQIARRKFFVLASLFLQQGLLALLILILCLHAIDMPRL